MAQTGPQTAQKLATAKEVDHDYGEDTLVWFFHGFGKARWLKVSIGAADPINRMVSATGPFGGLASANYPAGLTPNPGEQWWVIEDTATGMTWLDDLSRT